MYVLIKYIYLRFLKYNYNDHISPITETIERA